MKDLVVLAADKSIESGLRGLLTRHQSLGIRVINFDIFSHPHKDPGCLNTSAEFLQAFINQYRYALVVFDREGCGKLADRNDLEDEVEENLARVGWQHRSSVIVLDPELEIWVWTKSPHVDEILGWKNKTPSLREWLVEENLLGANDDKPKRPKEAMEIALEKVKKPRSSSLYLQLAQVVSLKGHQEPAFVKLQKKLQEWFPESS